MAKKRKSDPGVKLTYKGSKSYDNKTVEVIEASYNADENKNHSTNDVWEYYFDKEDGKIIANWVQSSDHANIIDNNSFARPEGILFHKDRTSYRLDDEGKKEYVRAKYNYYNYKVELNSK